MYHDVPNKHLTVNCVITSSLWLNPNFWDKLFEFIYGFYLLCNATYTRIYLPVIENAFVLITCITLNLYKCFCF